MAEEVQPKPIPTLITEDVTESLSRVPTLKVERLNADNHEFNLPQHLLAIVDPGDPQKQEEYSEGQDEWIRTYMIHVWYMPSQTDGKPIDEGMDEVIAAVTLALCADDGSTNQINYTRNGLASDSVLVSTETIGPIPKSLAYLINIAIDVHYATRQRDPYRKG